MKVFAWSPIRELMKKSGAEMVSRDAVDELIVYLEKVAKELTKKALEMSRHAGRKKLTKAETSLEFLNQKINSIQHSRKPEKEVPDEIN